MLNWVQDADGWKSNGFRIRLIEPHRWALTRKPEQDDAAIRIVSEPLAVERTLTAAKREAERLTAAEEAAGFRRRERLLLVVSLLGAVGIPLATPWTQIAFLGFLCIATRSLAKLSSSWLDRVLPSSEWAFFQ